MYKCLYVGMDGGCGVAESIADFFHLRLSQNLLVPMYVYMYICLYVGMLACMYVCNYVGMDVCCGDSENYF